MKKILVFIILIISININAQNSSNIVSVDVKILKPSFCKSSTSTSVHLNITAENTSKKYATLVCIQRLNNQNKWETVTTKPTINNKYIYKNGGFRFDGGTREYRFFAYPKDGSRRNINKLQSHEWKYCSFDITKNCKKNYTQQCI